MTTFTKPHSAPLSRHAGRRARQRAVPLQVVDYVLQHADRDVHVGSGCRSLTVRRSQCTRVTGALGRWAERAAGVAVIVNPANDVITVLRPARGRRGRRYRRQLRLRRGTWQ